MSRHGDAAEVGRALWAMLHGYAWLYPGEASAEDARRAREWLAAWAQLVPSWGCGCRQEWEAALRVCPPPLEQGRAAFWWWTVAVHDRVNVRLGKAMAHPGVSAGHVLLEGVGRR